jgi:hypothetical protein
MVLLSLLIGGVVGGVPGAVLAVPVAAAIELIVGGLQAREQPVAQDPTVVAPEETNMTDGPAAPSGGRDPASRKRRTARRATAGLS